MGETESIMKYSRAKYIKDLVLNLDQSWDNWIYDAAIEEEPKKSREYSVYLYPRLEFSHLLIHLAAFACTMSNLATDIQYSICEYNKSTYGEEMVQAIRIR